MNAKIALAAALAALAIAGCAKKEPVEAAQDAAADAAAAAGEAADAAGDAATAAGDAAMDATGDGCLGRRHGDR